MTTEHTYCGYPGCFKVFKAEASGEFGAFCSFDHALRYLRNLRVNRILNEARRRQRTEGPLSHESLNEIADSQPALDEEITRLRQLQYRRQSNSDW